MRKVLVVAVLLGILLAVFVPSVGATSGTAQVYVVHGIPGKDLGLPTNDLPVDIKVAGACAITNFTFGTIAGPVELPAGTYKIDISLSDGACGNAPVISERVLVGTSENLSLVAYLREGGVPGLVKFTNYVGPLRDGKSRLLVHHTANAPRVDITLKRPYLDYTSYRFRNVANAYVQYGQINTTINNGAWDVRIFPAGVNTPVFGPLSLNLASRKIYLVYAVGSLKNSTFTLLAKAIDPAY